MTISLNLPTPLATCCFPNAFIVFDLKEEERKGEKKKNSNFDRNEKVNAKFFFFFLFRIVFTSAGGKFIEIQREFGLQ